MLVRLSTVVVLALGGPVHAGPGGDFLSQAQSTLRTLIDRLRGETMPEGITKPTAASRQRRSTSRPNMQAGSRA
jgi:hypothetical protein